MDKRILVFFICVVTVLTLAGCARPVANGTELLYFPLDSTEGIIEPSAVQIDSQISSDGNGSLLITAPEPITVKLFEIGDIDIEDTTLIYRAKIRTEGVEGKVYLEMLCSFPGRGEYFSRGLQPLTGTKDWKTVETLFFLKKGENPDNVKLNLVIDGTGTVWIDDIKLLKAP